MRFDPAPLRTAAIAAAAFLALRIVYRLVFGGLGGRIVLVDLPTLRLGGPFAMVRLFGPVSLDGIGGAVVGALPFAALILAFGVLAAVVDLRRLLAAWARRGPGRSIARALGIAVATMPSLAASFHDARRAAALRGERGGPALLVPVFERTIERALALAASLEVRGFGARRRLDGRCEAPVRLAGAAFAHEPGGVPVLHDVTFALPPGRLVLVTGPTGSGKSTLLRAVNGLFGHFDGGAQSGVVEVGGLDRASVPPRECAGFVGAVGQFPRDGFAGRTVAGELGLALALRGVDPVIVAARAAEAAAAVGVAGLLERLVDELSAGEAVRVGIGAAILERPIVLTVDEPLAELDAVGRALVVDLLDRLAHEAGVCVLVAEHRVEALARVADLELAIDAGHVVERMPQGAVGDPLPPAATAPSTGGTIASGSGPVNATAPTSAADSDALSDTVPGLAEPAPARLEVDGVDLRRDDRVVVAGARFAVSAGEVLAVTGPNGAGKSSLLDAIADGVDGVRIDGEPLPRRVRERRERVALVPERLDTLFTTDSVAAECHRADRRHRRPGGSGTGPDTFARFAGLLGEAAGTTSLVGGLPGRPDRPGSADRLDRLAAAHPRDLSGGERLCLALAIQTAGAPHVLLVDEPARGLDAAARSLVARALGRLAADGTAVVLATHETGFARSVATSARRIEQGALGPAVAVVDAMGTSR
ncbi:ATP-binding cassette domain-containing protein [Agromyces seonyuensis]|uniref:ATP-binding cassette domain-containing protein n=1 Tax=Agromyces seonyuensis TaxID=2662446 RepID=A0A6I4NVB3_9MICO|nr:ATP-binding cassette domain-containing protein [Agromyces seonyuensis]MWB98396.1 ATP-binding cassette domain-containing protein [Agromyces seonyuensis]